jgi:hypothetical protein
MATIVRRTSKHGQTSYRAKCDSRAHHPSLPPSPGSHARRWVKITEAAIVEGRHFKTTEAKCHTLADVIDRSPVDVLPPQTRFDGARPGTATTLVENPVRPLRAC